ncbi:MAG: M6 family metalloprotease domain-containing protein [Actinomycetota bacterium]
MQLAALSLPRRLAGVGLATGLFLALAASFPTHASAASRPGCGVHTRAAKIVSLQLFRGQMKPARAAFFRRHKRAQTRRAFIAGQQRRLKALKRAVARCGTSGANAGPETAPDPETAPCSPSLYSAPFTEMNEGTTNSTLPLKPGSRIRAVMLFVDFPDLHSSESTTALYDRLVPRSRAWFNEVSYGQVQLDATPANSWFRMPHNIGSYGLRDGISWPEHHDYIADAVSAADGAVDFSGYDVIYVVAAKGTSIERSPAFHSYPGFGIHADGNELRHGATFFEDTRSDARYAANVLIHETGHLLGLPDLYDVPDPTFWRLFRFAGGWDMMSWNDPGGHFLAWQKWKLGWLEPSQLTCLSGPGELTTTITPLERAGGLKAIVVPTGLSSAYLIEARRRIGQDSRLCDEGILVYSVDAAVRSGYGPVRVRAAQPDGNGDAFNRCGPLYNATFDKASGEVARFVDDAAGLTIVVLSSSAKGYRVKVTRTSVATQGLPDQVAQGGASSKPVDSLAPPQAPLSAITFPFGVGWDLGPLTAD